MIATRTPRTYWCHHGRYEKTYHKLYAALVPDQGNCQTVEGEILRAISKLYYRFYNDGDLVRYIRHDINLPTAAHRFLCNVLPAEFNTALAELRSLARDHDEKLYAKAMETLTDRIIQWIKAKKGVYTPNTSGLDYLDTMQVKHGH
jgi:hypothetical protein